MGNVWHSELFLPVGLMKSEEVKGWKFWLELSRGGMDIRTRSVLISSLLMDWVYYKLQGVLVFPSFDRSLIFILHVLLRVVVHFNFAMPVSYRHICGSSQFGSSFIDN